MRSNTLTAVCRAFTPSSSTLTINNTRDLRNERFARAEKRSQGCGRCRHPQNASDRDGVDLHIPDCFRHARGRNRVKVDLSVAPNVRQPCQLSTYDHPPLLW